MSSAAYGDHDTPGSQRRTRRLVLVVDDDATGGMKTVDNLSARGFPALYASLGDHAEVLRQIEKTLPDVIVLDRMVG